MSDRNTTPCSSSILIAAFLLSCFLQGAVFAQSGMSIGVLAFRGDEAAMQRWSPTASYLSERISGYEFEIVPLTLESMEERIRDDSLDFVLTNTGNYVVLEHEYGISRLATLKARHLEREFTQFGAVIFSASERSDLKRLEDIAGHSLIAVSRKAFGGFQMAWRELIEVGIDPFNDLSKLEFNGFPQDDIVYSVIQGKIDVGTVRSGTLERMAADGLIDLDDVRVLGARDSESFPFLHSTRLYPEWPFAKTLKTPEQLAQRVAIALLEMGAESDAARMAFAAGWTIPLDYGPVLELFRKLEIGPYEHLKKPNLDYVWREYSRWILLSLAMAVLLIVLIILVARANRRISLSQHRMREEVMQRRQAQKSLAAHMDNLEHRVRERTQELAETNRRAREHQTQLAHVARLNTMGEMATGIAHELNQPLTAIRNYCNGCLRLLQTGKASQEELSDVLVSIEHDAQRAASIIKRLREFIKHGELEREKFMISDCIEPAVELLRPRLVQHDIVVDIDYARKDTKVHADRVQVEQVIVNLVLNAIDALAGLEEPALKRINIDVGQVENGQVAIAISDSGVGLQEPMIRRLFEPFFTTKTDGLGMGLSISRSIIEAHEGEIEYLRNERDQPTFRFTVPAT